MRSRLTTVLSSKGSQFWVSRAHLPREGREVDLQVDAVGQQLVVDVRIDHCEDLVVLDVVDEADTEDRRQAVERVV